MSAQPSALFLVQASTDLVGHDTISSSDDLILVLKVISLIKKVSVFKHTSSSSNSINAAQEFIIPTKKDPKVIISISHDVVAIIKASGIIIIF